MTRHNSKRNIPEVTEGANVFKENRTDPWLHINTPVQYHYGGRRKILLPQYTMFTGIKPFTTLPRFELA